MYGSGSGSELCCDDDDGDGDGDEGLAVSLALKFEKSRDWVREAPVRNAVSVLAREVNGRSGFPSAETRGTKLRRSGMRGRRPRAGIVILLCLL